MNRWIHFVVALWFGGCCAAAMGQEQTEVQLKPVEFKGTIEELEQGVIAVKSGDKTIYVGLNPDSTKMLCVGTAERSYLKPGVSVRFSGTFDKKGQFQGPIEKLSVVTPSPTAQPGIHSDEIVAFDEAEEKPKRKSKAAKAAEAKEAKEDTTYVVVGTVKLLKDNQLQVLADGKQVRAALAEEVEITVEIDDYSLATAGDEITVRGRMPDGAEAAEFPRALGDEVTITFAKPLAVATKAPKKKPVKRGAK